MKYVVSVVAVMLVGFWLVGPAHVEASTLALEYHLDETTGTTAHDSSNDTVDNPGTVIGASGYWDASGYSGGCFNTGGSGAVRVEHATNLNPSNELEVDFYVNPDAIPASGTVMLLQKFRAYEVYLDSTGKVWWAIRAPNGPFGWRSIGNNHVLLTTGKWYHINATATQNEGTLSVSLAVDGNETSWSWSDSMAPLNDPLFIGWANGGTRPFTVESRYTS